MIKRIFLLFFLTLAISALAAPDSLGCRMIDWLDAPGATLSYGAYGHGEYAYPGTWLWDMAMGDSFLVWCPGTDWFYFVNPFSQTDVETLAGFDYGSVSVKGVTKKDSIVYLVGGGGVNSLTYEETEIDWIGHLHVDWASFHYAVIRDTFLYTASTGSYGLHCINIANPESIFVVWNAPSFSGQCGMTVVGDYVYTASQIEDFVSFPDDGWRRPRWQVQIVRISGDTIGIGDSLLFVDNASHGDFASDGEHALYVYTDMTDWIAGGQDYTLEDSHLEAWGEDYSFTWSDYDSEGVFGIEVLSDTLIAVGFEHGFSILNYTNLDSIYEVARYRDTDSVFAFTHFARKDNRMYAMAHPHPDTCRMYMFELDDNVWASIEESPNPVKPSAFTISAHPNPFNSAVSITAPAGAEIEVFDVNGRRISVIARRANARRGNLSDDEIAALPSVTRNDGVSEFVWQPSENLGSGVYLVRAKFPQETASAAFTKRIVYLK